MEVVLKKMMEAGEPVCRVTHVSPEGPVSLFKVGRVEDVFKKGFVEIIPNLDVMYSVQEVREDKRSKPMYQTNCKMENSHVGIPLSSVLEVKEIVPGSSLHKNLLDILDKFEYAMNNDGNQKPDIFIPENKLLV